MKKYLCILMLALLSVACVEKDTDSLFTQLTLTVRPPQGIEMRRFQATMVFENINTRQRTSTSDFENGQLNIRLMKGLYRLSINEGGGLAYTDEKGDYRFSEVVISNDPLTFVADHSEATVDLILKN